MFHIPFGNYALYISAGLANPFLTSPIRLRTTRGVSSSRCFGATPEKRPSIYIII